MVALPVDIWGGRVAVNARSQGDERKDLVRSTCDHRSVGGGLLEGIAGELDVVGVVEGHSKGVALDKPARVSKRCVSAADMTATQRYLLVLVRYVETPRCSKLK